MKCEDYVNEFLQKFGTEFKSRLERRTPVKTGYAQSQYVMDVNTDDLTITNNVDYIVRLEEGHSQQAPQGMLRITLEESQDIADEIIRSKT
ncbi:hypothetical protein ACOYR4_15410 [Acidovorax sp. M14]|uniref:hypothetical protein n=1 Tax=Acidovorax sp. M14 TaxID=3411354 RepID=UPI003BF5CF96